MPKAKDRQKISLFQFNAQLEQKTARAEFSQDEQERRTLLLEAENVQRTATEIAFYQQKELISQKHHLVRFLERYERDNAGIEESDARNAIKKQMEKEEKERARDEALNGLAGLFKAPSRLASTAKLLKKPAPICTAKTMRQKPPATPKPQPEVVVDKKAGQPSTQPPANQTPEPTASSWTSWMPSMPKLW